jgi:hypothetical protein
MVGVMSTSLEIDVAFDVRSDTPIGKDPDSRSPTLRRYHRLLWSKPLPNGVPFDLVTSTPRTYLHHNSDLGEFSLSSDAVIRTFRNVRAAASVINQIPEVDLEAFSRVGHTIGGMMVFPGNQIDRKQTINQRRGTKWEIGDRFDLTLETIRRHYLGEASPLAETLARYADFFALFEDFRGYVQFFLLQDMVTDTYREVRFFTLFENFRTPAIPRTLDEYKEYRRLTLEFVAARNLRIAAYCEQP